MAEKVTTAIIKLEDPFSRDTPHLDFQVLRRAGLEHIGELSGKIWTDHNTHDPGITILEELCYALVDLGYRSSFPLQDLLARAPGTNEDKNPFARNDNFFTPLEILGCNPTTVADYRRLLLEVKGMRNAWLEPLWKLDPTAKVVLNGLYRVLVEMEAGEKQEDIGVKLVELLPDYRNLCEDFEDLVFLERKETGVRGTIEIEKSANAEVVYEQILRAIEAHISPRILYYTLSQMLDKGKTMEEIFAGRPFLERSRGFVDQAELDALPRRKELYASDLYRIIGGIEGVVSASDVDFVPGGDDKNGKDANFAIPLLLLGDCQVASFSLDLCEIDLKVKCVTVPLNKGKVHKRVAAKPGQTDLERKDLDLRIPGGTFDPERFSHESIQNDFPMVYGIGVNGLGANESLQRRVEAWQLQGYLLFYDQLLANYLAQMGNFRGLFSMRQESERGQDERRIRVNDGLAGLPGLAKLVQSSAGRNHINGSILAVPVERDKNLDLKLDSLTLKDELCVQGSCPKAKGVKKDEIPHLTHPTRSLRDSCVRQAMRDLSQGDYEIHTHQDSNGYFFTLRFTEAPRILLVGWQRYDKPCKARSAGNHAAFLGTREDYFRKVTQREEIGDSGKKTKTETETETGPKTEDGTETEKTWSLRHRFDLVANFTADTAYLQYLLENRELYLERREAFLDHLLARFSSQFTDYALLRYQKPGRTQPDREQAVEDKSRFLSHFDKLSRDRGKAFNPLKPSWGTENVSGYEARVAQLAGMGDGKRRSLCKFEVVQRLGFTLLSPEGKPWIKSTRAYDPDAELEDARVRLLEKLRTTGSAGTDGEFETLTGEGLSAARLARIFSEKHGKGTIGELHHHRLRLTQGGGNGTPRDGEIYSSGEKTLADRQAFAKSLGLSLTPTGEGSDTYYDSGLFHPEYPASYSWHDPRNESSGYSLPKELFPDPDTARVHFLQKENWLRPVTPGELSRWQLTDPGDGRVRFVFRDAMERAKDLWNALEAARKAGDYKVVPAAQAGQAGEAGEAAQVARHIEVRAPDGKILGMTPPLDPAALNDPEAAKQALREWFPRVPSPEIDGPVYLWWLVGDPDKPPVLKSKEAYSSPEDAARKFDEEMRALMAEGTDSEAARGIYTIKPEPLPTQYQFVYFDPFDEKDEETPLLRGVQTFDSPEAAGEAYSYFVRALPRPGRTGWLAHEDKPDDPPLAKVAGETMEEEKLKHVSANLRAYLGNLFAAPHETGGPEQEYIYRLIDKDNPVARTPKGHESEVDAQAELWIAKEFKPYPVPRGNTLVDVIRLDKFSRRYRYVIRLVREDAKDGEKAQDVPVDFLFSYQAYNNREAAQTAGEANGLELIEIASEEKNYQVGKAKGPIAVSKDIQIDPDDDPDSGAGYRAILAEGFGEDTAAAARLAKRYPIRIIYKEKEEKEDWRPRQIDGYKFRGFDPDAPNDAPNDAPKDAPKDARKGKPVWEDGKLHKTHGEALAAYAVFVFLLKKRELFRVVLENGCYRVHLLEILARSDSFDTETEAWKTAALETTVIPRLEEGCGSFIMVPEDYRLADFTCSSDTACGREEWKKEAHRKAPALGRAACVYNLERIPDPKDSQKVRIRYTISDGCHLESIRSYPQNWDVEPMIDRWFHLAVDRENYELDGDRKDVLIDPFDRRDVIANLTQDTEPFDKARFVKAARRFPVHQQEDGYRFRLSDPDNDEDLDKHLKDPKADKQSCRDGKKDARAFCCKPYLFESTRAYPTRCEALEAFRDFVRKLVDIGNYQDEDESGVGPYSFWIANNREYRGTWKFRKPTRHPYCHPEMEGAAEAAARTRACVEDEGLHLLEHILLRPRPPESQPEKPEKDCPLPAHSEPECRLTWESDPDGDDPCADTGRRRIDYIPGADPYSFWATVVLPEWYPRFKTDESREFFSEMLHREAPAMVALNILWLGPEQMCAFEKDFRAWLEAHRSGEPPDAGDGDKPLCTLVKRVAKLLEEAPLPNKEDCRHEAPKCLEKCDGVDEPLEPEGEPPAAVEETAVETDKAVEPDESVKDCESGEGNEATAAEPQVIQDGKTEFMETTNGVSGESDKTDAESAKAQEEPPAAGDAPPEKEDRKEEHLDSGKAPSVDSEAVRRAATSRKEEYRKALDAVARTDENLVATKAYMQAVFFITNAPSVESYVKLAERILAQVSRAGGRKKNRQLSFKSILQNAIWYLLDQLMQKSPREVPGEAAEKVPGLLERMKSKGMDMQDTAEKWKGTLLEEVLKVPDAAKLYIDTLIRPKEKPGNA